MDAKLNKRFWIKVAGGDVDTCWEWTAHRDRAGYGRINVNNTPKLAHRLAYEYLRDEIPEGLDLDHLCRNKSCVNPWHLEPVTRSVNLRRVPLGTHCERGHEYAPGSFYQQGRKRTCIECQRRRNQEWYADPDHRQEALERAKQQKQSKRTSNKENKS